MMERTDRHGYWTSEDGTAWTLVTPSQEFLDRQAADNAVAAAREDDAQAERAAAKAKATAQEVAARLTVVDKVKADVLTDEQVAEIAPLFDPLTAGTQVDTGDVYRWDGTLVEALQPHTVEAWWLDLASLPPSLYKVHRTDDGTGPIEWQPGISVTTEDQVWYDGVLYDVIQAHTTQEGWTPPATPALFTPVEV